MKRTYSAAAMRGKRSRDIGEAGETLVRHALQRLGMQRINRVHTPFKIIRINDPRAPGGSQIVNAVPQESVEGDFRCVDPTGKSVLVEVKTHTTTDRVVWSDFEDHQIEALNGHHLAGARALVAVVLHDRAQVLEWPIPGFGPGGSIRILEGKLYLTGKKGGAPAKDAPESFQAESKVTLAKVRKKEVEAPPQIPCPPGQESVN